MPYGSLITDAQLAAATPTSNPPPSVDWLTYWTPLIEDQVEQYLKRPLKYQAGVVEWPVSFGREYILLDRTPVWAVTEVRYDPAGGFGQKANTFGTDTVLTAGDDYLLDIDGDGGLSESGTLLRVPSTWGSRRAYQTGLLTSWTEAAKGTIKVTYTGGYKPIGTNGGVGEIPGVVSAAVAQAICVWYTTLCNVGVTLSESVPGYNYSQAIGVNLGDNIFAGVREMLTSLKRMRPGAGSRA